MRCRAQKAAIPIIFLMKQHPSETVNYCELAVLHIFRLAETCKYLGVIGDHIVTIRREQHQMSHKEIYRGLSRLEN
jgi:hypothetical protein